MQDFNEQEMLFLRENVVLEKVDGEIAIKLIRTDVEIVDGYVDRAASAGRVHGRVVKAERVGRVTGDVDRAASVRLVDGHVGKVGSAGRVTGRVGRAGSVGWVDGHVGKAASVSWVGSLDRGVSVGSVGEESES